MSFRRGRGGGGGRGGAGGAGGKVGPAISLMPGHIRAIFMPNPPLKHIPPRVQTRKHSITGVAEYLSHLNDFALKNKQKNDTTPPNLKDLKERKRRLKQEQVKKDLEPKIQAYREEYKACNGEFNGMNTYNTLFVGRLSYEITERKLLREMETYGPVKDIKVVTDRDGKSRGYAFVEFEHEEDMKRAYREADGLWLEGRHIVCDVERGHTVPSWLPRRLGGGLGGTRLGSQMQNITRPGRYDPARPDAPPSVPQHPSMMGPPGGGGGYHYHGGGPPPPRGSYDYSMDRGRRGAPPPPRDGGGDYYGGGRKRGRSPSPDRGHYGRRRY